jgi:undecaprenyl-diphosphatase
MLIKENLFKYLVFAYIMPEKEKRKRFAIDSKSKILIISILCAAALALSFIFDKKIAMAFSGIRNPILDFVMIAVAASSTYLIVLLTTVFVFLGDRKEIVKYWFSFALALFVMILIKMILHRQRPFNALDITVPAALIKASYSTWDFSFPSNHSALSFVSVPFLKGKFLVIWIVIAALIIFSRLYFGFHYLSDVIAGIMIGLVVPIIVRKYII